MNFLFLINSSYCAARRTSSGSQSPFGNFSAIILSSSAFSFLILPTHIIHITLQLSAPPTYEQILPHTSAKVNRCLQRFPTFAGHLSTQGDICIFICTQFDIFYMFFTYFSLRFCDRISPDIPIIMPHAATTCDMPSLPFTR